MAVSRCLKPTDPCEWIRHQRRIAGHDRSRAAIDRPAVLKLRARHLIYLYLQVRLSSQPRCLLDARRDNRHFVPDVEVVLSPAPAPSPSHWHSRRDVGDNVFPFSPCPSCRRARLRRRYWKPWLMIIGRSVFNSWNDMLDPPRDLRRLVWRERHEYKRLSWKVDEKARRQPRSQR